MAIFKQGRLPAFALRTWKGVKLGRKTAAAIKHLDAIYHQQSGRYLTPELPKGGYRTLADTADMIRHPWPSTKYNRRRGVSMSAPGSPGAVHETGKALDVAEGRDWMAIHGPRNGWSHPNPVNDPGHFVYTR